MKRFLRAALIVFGVLLALYLVALVVLSMSPKVDDRDLRVSREALSEEANGFNSLRAATAQMVWPDETEFPVWQLAGETNWNDTAAAEVLAKNQLALAALDAALAKPGFQVPDFRFTDQLSYLSDWKKLSLLAAVRGNVCFRAGKEREAFEQALNLVRLGNRMGNARGLLLHYLVGNSVSSMGLAQMRRWAGRAHLPPQELAALAAQLKATSDNGAALANSLKMEYQKTMEILADLRAGKLQNSDFAPLISVKLLPTFNSGKTRLLFANAHRELLKALSLAYSDAKLPDLERRPGPFRLLLSGNVAGQVCYYQLMPSPKGSVATMHRQKIQTEGTGLTLALRAYQLKNARLPDDLAALVPEFLDQVPSDSFDGKPMRYDRERKLVYSIGPNLRDDNGQDKDEQKRPLDYPFPLEF